MLKIKKIDTICVFTDGGARGNPGPAGIGAVLQDKDKNTIAEISQYIGHATNNVAEYMAVIYGLLESLVYQPDKVMIYLDSQLVARHLKGEYKVRNAEILKFFNLTRNLIQKFKKVEIHEIPREKNKLADKLVNEALDLKSLF
ncbi:MAG: ribonuclease HI family protein [Candidatus Omnitrophota bacterium]